MDWSKGYSATYYMEIVDPPTWRDIETIQITGGSISRENEGLQHSASIECVDYSGAEKWVRVYLDTHQNGASGHEALFTGLATSPEYTINHRRKNNTLECYSVLKPAEDIILQRGYYIPAGTNGATAVKKLLSVTPAPVTIEGEAPLLSSSIIAEDGETNLSMCEKILTAINWRLRIDGRGEITITAQAEEANISFDPLENDVVETEIEVSYDWFEVPNVFQAIEDDMTSIARDDNPDSPLSTISRGREIWMQESGCDLAENESIADYAQRRLTEEQRVAEVVSYDRRYIPDLFPGDLVILRYPEQGIDGQYYVTSQDIELGYGARTSEEVEKK